MNVLEKSRKALALFLALVLLFSVVPVISPEVSAKKQEKSLSDALAELWGFSTDPGELSRMRDAMGENPMGAPDQETGVVGRYSVTPREIAIIDGYFKDPSSTSLPESSNNNGAHDYVKFYDNIALSGSAAAMTDVSGSYPTTTFQTGGGFGYPRAAVSADLNGDGTDEIVQCHLDLQANTTKTLQSSSPAGINFYVTVNRYGQTGIKYEDYVFVTSYDFTNPSERYIPENINNWSSFIQLVSGDFNGDGREDVAVSCGPEGVFVISVGDGGDANRPSVTKLPFDATLYRTGGSNPKVSHFSLAAGDVDFDARDEIVATFTENIFAYMGQADLIVWEYDKEKDSYVMKNRKQTGLASASVTVADINYDMKHEIVVGGFNVNSHEMTLSYCVYDDSGTSLSGFTGTTELRDDELKATVNYGFGGNIDTRARDKANDPHRYGHSWNWTIPLQRVCLAGSVAGANFDQIFFGNGMYYYNFDTKVFDVFDDKASVKTLSEVGEKEAMNIMNQYALSYRRDDIDANNASIIAMIPGTFLAPDENNLDEGREQLLVYYVKDNMKDDMSFEAAFFHLPVDAANMDVKVTKKYLAKSAWGAENFYPLITAPNIDDDTYFIQYVSKITTMSDPKITAVIQAAPYFKDIPTYLKQDFTPGGTEYGAVESEGHGGGFNVEFENGYTAVADAVVAKSSHTLGYNVSLDYKRITSVFQEIGYFNESLQDAVVMQCQPVDVYLYQVLEPGAAQWEPISVSVPGYVSTKTYSIDKYNELVEQHNVIAEAYNAEMNPKTPVNTLTPITYGDGETDLFTHTPGEPWTYPKETKEFHLNNKKDTRTASNAMSVGGVGSGMGNYSAVRVEVKDEVEQRAGVYYHSEFEYGSPFLSVGGEFDLSASGGYNYEGTSTSEYAARLNNYPDNAKGYDLTATLNVYRSNLNGAAPDSSGVPVVAYTVQEAKGLPKLPDNIEVLIDEATGSSVTVAYDLPALSNLDMVPDTYRLYVYDNYSGSDKWVEVANNKDKTLPMGKDGKNKYIVKGLESGTEYMLKMKVEKNDKRTNEYVFAAKTKVVGDPPVINEQPKSVHTSQGKTVEFTVKASLPETAKKDSKLRYNWYYAEKAEDGKYDWKKLEKAGVKEGSLLGATVSGYETDTLSLSNIPISADGVSFGCVVGYMISDTSITANTTKAVLNVSEQELQNFTVTYSSGPNGKLTAISDKTPVPSGGVMPHYSLVVFTAEPEDGYIVNKWTKNGEELETVGNELTVPELTEDIAVKVTFDKARVNVTYGTEDSGSVSAVAEGGIPIKSGTAVTAGSAITFTAAPNEGMSFLGWEIMSNETGEYRSVQNDDGTKYTKPEYTLKATENITLRAVFGEAVVSEIKFLVKDDVPANGRSVLKITRADGELLAELKANDVFTASADAGTITFTAVPETGAKLRRLTLTPSDPAIKPVTVETGGIPIASISCDYDVSAEFISIVENKVSYDGSYAAEIEAFVGGSAIASGSMVRYGSDVTFKAVSAEGTPAYFWNINGKTYASTEGSLTVSEISEDITAVPVFAQSLEDSRIKASLRDYLNDINEHWAKDAIAALAESGAFDKLAQEITEPDDPLTRAAFGVLYEWFTNSSFVDDYSYLAIFDDGVFEPDALITKEQLAVMLYRSLTTKGVYLPSVDYETQILDIGDVSGWALEAVYYLAEKGLVLGDSYGNFNPQKNVTVGEFCSILSILTDIMSRPVEYSEPFAEETASTETFPAIEPTVPSETEVTEVTEVTPEEAPASEAAATPPVN